MMTNSLQKKLYENGYLIVKNVLNFRRDLKPILNDMEFVMDCLIQKYAKKRDIKKVLNFDFKKKYSYMWRDGGEFSTEKYNFGKLEKKN